MSSTGAHAALELTAHVAFLGLGLRALVVWYQTRRVSAARLVAAFGLVAVVVILGRIFGDQAPPFIGRVLVSALVGFPLALLWFSDALAPMRRRGCVLAFVATGLTLAATWTIPADVAESNPDLLAGYALLFLAAFVGISVVASVRLWRAGRTRSRLVRSRLRLLAAGVGTVALSLAISGMQGEGASDTAAMLPQAISIVAAVVFWLGFAPPRILRETWRRQDEAETWQLVTDLLSRSDRTDVADHLLPRLVSVTGALSAEIVRDGANIATVSPRPSGKVAGVDEIALPWVDGQLVVTIDDQTPVFGRDDLALLERLVMVARLVEAQQHRVELERNAREHLELAEAMRTTLVSSVSHELRTPLTIVRGFAETLRQAPQALSPEQLVDVAERIVGGSKRLEVIVEDLLSLSAPSGQGDDLQAIALAPPIRRLAAASAAQWDRDVAIEVAATAEGAVTLAATKDLERMLGKLLDNALRYSPETEPVSIRLRPLGDAWEITVTDRGPGIDPALRATVLAPFARGAVHDPAAPGLGLGLTLAKRLADGYGGRLAIGAGPDGIGAAVSITLPAALPPGVGDGQAARGTANVRGA